MTFTIAIFLFWEISLLIVLSEMIICVPPEIQMFSDSRSLPPSTGDTRNYANDRSAFHIHFPWAFFLHASLLKVKHSVMVK